MLTHYSCVFFFFNDTATTEIYTLSLHDALPISRPVTETTQASANRCLRICPSFPLSRRERGPGGEELATRQGYHVLRSEEHTSELQSPCNLVCRLLLEKKKKTRNVGKI